METVSQYGHSGEERAVSSWRQALLYLSLQLYQVSFQSCHFNDSIIS